MTTPPPLKQETLKLLEELMRVSRRDYSGIMLDQPDWTELSAKSYPRSEIEDPLVVMLDYQTPIPDWFEDEDRVEHLGNSSYRDGISVWRLKAPKDLTELALTTPLVPKSQLLD